ncbi:MAG: prolipoprotein diacylglyceryl transferase [Flavobacteriales bacterium]|nr:prolipoprotein diacylglyceryl transferase [Flavobacteriales bacterium]
MFSYITWEGTKGIEIGSFTLHFYSLMFVCAFLCGFYIFKKIFKEENIDLELLDKVFLYMFFAVLIGARSGEVFFYRWDYFKHHPIEWFLPIQENPNSSFLGISGYEFTGFAGLASHGAAVLIVICIFILKYKFFREKPTLWLFDRISLTIALAGFFIRLGNFFNSEIVGKPSDSDFAVLFKQQSLSYGAVVPRHASQLYESFLYLILFLVLYFLFFKTKIKLYTGRLFGIFLISLFSIRFFVEFLKEPQGDEYITLFGLNSGQTLSIPFIIAGIIILVTSKNRKIKDEK